MVKALILILSLFCLTSTLHSQSLMPEDVVPANSLGVTQYLPHSPSIASFHNLEESGSNRNKEGLIAAYAYNESVQETEKRRVGISRSLDSGQTWEVIRSHQNLPEIRYQGDQNKVLKNLEDPQVIANDDILMLIVRAFSEDQNQFAGTGYDGGAGYQGLPGTVYLRSGIYMLISTDKGNNWGHWNGSTWNANQWLKIDEHQASTNSPATLEWPRVAWRNDYINGNEYGYIGLAPIC